MSKPTKGWGYVSTSNDDLAEGHIVVLSSKILFRPALGKTVELPIDTEYTIETEY